jgi:methionine-rich copper-binding protein CopC
MKYLVPPIAVALCLMTGAAQAHSHLESSTPNEGSTVSASPTSIELKFSEAVQVTALSIQKGDEKQQLLGPLPAKPTDKISVAAPSLEPGKYTVNYRVVSDDNHIMSGALHFAVGTMDHSKMDPEKMDHGKMKMDGATATDHH